MIHETLPTPILGNITAITITSPDLEASLAYYRRLGFAEVFRDNFPFPWIQVTDGQLLIMFRKAEESYLALTYYAKDAQKAALEIEQKGIVFVSKPKPGEWIQRFVFKSPDNLIISLVTIPDGFRKPEGPSMLTMNPADYFRPEAYTNKTIGMFGELAHPVKDLDQSIAFWQTIGFSVLSKFESPYPWAILSDGLAVAGLHQTNNFTYPVITYFAADMPAKIEALKANGLENFTEKGAGNIVLTTPEKQYINLFKMG